MNHDHLIPFSNDEVGITLAYPKGWTIKSDPSFGVMLGTTEAALDARGSILGEATIFMRVMAADAVSGDTPAAKLTIVLTQMMGVPVINVAEPEPTTINGQAALLIDVSGTQKEVAYAGVAVAVTSGDRLAVAISKIPAMNADEFRPVVEAVFQSIQLREPVAEVIDLSVIAGTLVDGELVSSTLTAAARANWRFSATAGEQVIITVLSKEETQGLLFDVFDNSATSIMLLGRAQSKSSRFMPIPVTGDYMVSVRGFAGSTGEYTVKLERVTFAPAGLQSAQDLVGIWQATYFVIRYDDDGTYHLATRLDDLASDAWDEGEYHYADKILTYRTDGKVAGVSKACRYALEVTTTGAIVFAALIEEEIEARGKLLPGIVLTRITA